MPRTNKKSQHRSREYDTLELRGRPTQFRRIKQAAELKGMSVTDFIILSVDAAAIKAIESANSWALGERDTEILMNALANPPEPNSRMVAAFRSHKLRVESI